MKVLLRDAAEREQGLVHEKDELQQKVSKFFVTCGGGVHITNF